MTQDQKVRLSATTLTGAVVAMATFVGWYVRDQADLNRQFMLQQVAVLQRIAQTVEINKVCIQSQQQSLVRHDKKADVILYKVSEIEYHISGRAEASPRRK